MSDDLHKNAHHVISCFGGIRPMAKKLGVPVTTVQGWKKRNAIPEDRIDEIITSAKKLNIDLSKGINSKKKNAQETPQKVYQTPKKTYKDEGIEIISPHQIKTESQETTKRILIGSVAVIAIFAIGAVFTFNKSNPPSEELLQSQSRLEALEAEFDSIYGRVEEVEERTSVLEKITPQNLNERILDVQKRTSELSQKASNEISAVLNRVDQLNASLQNGASLEAEIQNLKNVIQNQKTELTELQKDVFRKIDAEALTQGNLTKSELQAATMLIALTQLRSSIDRQSAFADDLTLLRSLTDEDDQELQEAITRLSPYAQEGVLSLGGLQKQLKLLSNDIVSASLKGENISIKEKALARFNNVVSITREGEPVLATETEKQVALAQAKLKEGDIKGATEILKALEGESAQAAQPFVEQAQAALLAKSLQGDVMSVITSKLGGLAGPARGSQPIFLNNTAPQTPESE